MTTAVQVVRRFEILVGDGNSVGDIVRAVEEAVPPEIKSEVNAVQQPPLVEVRLEGAARGVREVMKLIAQAHGPRIRNNVLRTRARGGGQNGSVHPDLNARERIGAEALPPAGKSVPAEVIVAIVDSGLMLEHPAFTGHRWTGDGKQFIEGKSDNDLTDQDGHGTSLAGTILSAAADARVKLMTAKFFDAANPAQPDNAAAALEFAAENAAKIILLAWDVGLGSVRLEHAFRKACTRALVVIAAGNYGSDNDWYDGQSTARAPVRYAKDYPSSTITVMATDESDEKAWFSNYGRETVDLAAPGVGIMSTRRAVSAAPSDEPKRYRAHSGTSSAAAYVAGAAALLMSRYPSLTVQQIKDCLVHSDSVAKPPVLKCASKGRLYIPAALARAAELAKGKP